MCHLVKALSKQQNRLLLGEEGLCQPRMGNYFQDICRYFPETIFALLLPRISDYFTPLTPVRLCLTDASDLNPLHLENFNMTL